MVRQYDYKVVITAKHADGTVSRTKGVKVRASSEERAVTALTEAVERETNKRVTEIIFSKVTFA